MPSAARRNLSILVPEGQEDQELTAGANRTLEKQKLDMMKAQFLPSQQVAAIQQKGMLGTEQPRMQGPVPENKQISQALGGHVGGPHGGTDAKACGE